MESRNNLHIQNTGSDATVFIFNKMTPVQAKLKLKEAAVAKDIPHDLANCWLICESSSGPFLTAHCIIYDDRNKMWVGFGDMHEGKPLTNFFERTSCDGQEKISYSLAKRFGLTTEGWVEVSGQKIDAFKQSIGAGNIAVSSGSVNMDAVDSLLKILLSKGLLIENRINPRKVSEQSTDSRYSFYTPLYVPSIKLYDNQVNPKNKITGRMLSLSPEMAAPLVCTSLKVMPADGTVTDILDFELMKDPVVLKSDGNTYERNRLFLDKKYTEKDVYPNLRLKIIIDHLSSGANKEEASELIKKEVMCPISQGTLCKPVISPSGISYEESAINLYLDAGKNNVFNAAKPDPINRNILISVGDLVQNNNLNNFIATFNAQWRDNYSPFI